MFKEDCTFMTNAFWLVLNKVSLSNTRPTHYFLAKIAFLLIFWPMNYLLTVMIKDTLQTYGYYGYRDNYPQENQ